MTIDSVNITALSTALATGFLNKDLDHLTICQETSIPVKHLADNIGQLHALNLKALLTKPDPELKHVTGGQAAIAPKAHNAGP